MYLALEGVCCNKMDCHGYVAGDGNLWFIIRRNFCD